MLKITFLKKKFKNLPFVQYFLDNGYDIHQPLGGRQYRINGQVDIYPNSEKICIVKNSEWVVTTPETIIEIVKSKLSPTLKTAEQKFPEKKLIKMTYKEWRAQELLKQIQK